MGTQSEAEIQRQLNDLVGRKMRQLGIRARDPKHPMHDQIEWDPETGLPIMPADNDRLARLILAALDEQDSGLDPAGGVLTESETK